MTMIDHRRMMRFVASLARGVRDEVDEYVRVMTGTAPTDPARERGNSLAHALGGGNWTEQDYDTLADALDFIGGTEGLQSVSPSTKAAAERSLVKFNALRGGAS